MVRQKRIGIIGGQAGTARDKLIGVISYAHCHTDWRLAMREWMGMSPLMDLRDAEALIYLGPDRYPGAPRGDEQRAQLENLGDTLLLQAAAWPDGPRAPAALEDFRAIGAAAAEHLLELPLESYAFFADEDEPPAHRSMRDGFVETIENAGHRCALYVDPEPWCSRDWSSIQRRLTEWLAELAWPVGLGVFDDARGRFCVEACGQAGILCPQQVAVIGAGNDPLACLAARPGLSSVDTDPADVGYAAARLLDDILTGRRSRRTMVRVAPHGAVKRGSSDYLAIDDAEVLEAVRHMESHLDAALSVAAVAEQVGLSRRGLELRFNAALGHSPAREIRRLQMRRARQLLRQTELPVSSIARACGFASHSRFSATFRRSEGLTPSEFRRSCPAEPGIARQAGPLHAPGAHGIVRRG
jgi:LacI family transcriptional regulator